MNELRTAPLTSSSLFGGRVEQVLEKDNDRQVHALIVAQAQKSSSNKRAGSSPASKPEAKKKKSSTPASTQASASFEHKGKKRHPGKPKGKKPGKSPFKAPFPKGSGPKGKP